MHKYYLITPRQNAPEFDPGVTFITHGCKYLIKQADPDALFLHISNIHFHKPDWDLLFDQADCLVLAGNPHYDPSNINVFWNYGIWDLVDQATSRGIPVADLWGYSSHPLPGPDIKTMTQTMLANPRNQRTLKIQSRLPLIITRDLCSQSVLSSIRQDVDALPCCSYFAHRYFHVEPKPRTFNAVVLRHRPRQDWILAPFFALSEILTNEKPTFLVCHTRAEYWWAKANLKGAQNLLLIYDPPSLLDFYSRCDRVISIRLHATIPCLSLGCKVINLAIDTRSHALELFNIPSVPYTDLADQSISLDFHSFDDPQPALVDYFVKHFQETIVSQL